MRLFIQQILSMLYVPSTVLGLEDRKISINWFLSLSTPTIWWGKTGTRLVLIAQVSVLTKCSRRMEGRRWPFLPRTEQLGIREDSTNDGKFGVGPQLWSVKEAGEGHARKREQSGRRQRRLESAYLGMRGSGRKRGWGLGSARLGQIVEDFQCDRNELRNFIFCNGAPGNQSARLIFEKSLQVSRDTSNKCEIPQRICNIGRGDISLDKKQTALFAYEQQQSVGCAPRWLADCSRAPATLEAQVEERLSSSTFMSFIFK